MKLVHGPRSVMWYTHVGDSRTEAVTRVAPGTATKLTKLLRGPRQPHRVPPEYDCCRLLPEL